MVFTLEFRLKIFRLLFQNSQFKKNFLKFLKKEFFEAEYEHILLLYLKKFGDTFMSYDTFLNKMLQTEQGEKDYKRLTKYNSILRMEEKINDDDAVYDTIKDFIIKSKVQDELISIYSGIKNVHDINMDGIPDRLINALNVIPTKEYAPYFYFDETENRVESYKSRGVSEDIIIPLLNQEDSRDHCIRAKEFVVIAAPSTRGKTAIMLNLLEKAQAYRINTLYITFEIRKSKIAERLDATMTQTNISDFGTEADNISSNVKSRGLFFGKNIVIEEFSSNTKTVSDIEEYIKFLKYTYNFQPGIVFIDYADLMREQNYKKGDSKAERVASIYKDLVGLQQKLGITFITASQTNTSTTKKVVVSMEDMSDSPAAKVASIDKTFVVSQTKLMFEKKVFILNTDKDRNGRGRGMVYLYEHDWDKQTIYLKHKLSWDDIMKYQKEENAYMKKIEKSYKK